MGFVTERDHSLWLPLSFCREGQEWLPIGGAGLGVALFLPVVVCLRESVGEELAGFLEGGGQYQPMPSLGAVINLTAARRHPQ